MADEVNQLKRIAKLSTKLILRSERSIPIHTFRARVEITLADHPNGYAGPNGAFDDEGNLTDYDAFLVIPKKGLLRYRDVGGTFNEDSGREGDIESIQESNGTAFPIFITHVLPTSTVTKFQALFI